MKIELLYLHGRDLGQDRNQMGRLLYNIYQDLNQ